MSQTGNQKWVLASGNAGKLREFSRLFAPHQVELLPQGDLGVSECDEPYSTFLENALIKARNASSQTGLPALADDSGLCVPALKGAPGVLSARYATLFGHAKSDANNNQALAEKMQGIADRAAYFVCCLVWVAHAEDPTPIVAQRMWWGQFQAEASGAGGFGYDPHFYVPEHGCTAADMPSDLKNTVSHRAQATQALLGELSLRLGWKV